MGVGDAGPSRGNGRSVRGGAAPEWDVIGAGPGGSTAATLLAEAGVRVLVLEREHFPRFHVGESLLPAAELLVTVLGIEPDPNVFLFKAGAQFVCEATGRQQTFDFNDALAGPQRYAWHVDRARFDTLLRDRALEAGAEIRHGVRVDDVGFEPERVRVSSGDHEETARFFIDATGLDRFLARRMDAVRPYERFGKAAVFTHFLGLGDGARREFAPGNDIRIIVIPDGWLWAIPLTGDRLSVGLVSRKPGLRRERLDEYIDGSALFGRVLPGAERAATHMIGNYSFSNAAASGPRYACVGDAACFIDPVFSSGVSLAVRRALLTVERLIPALAAGSEAEPDLMGPVGEVMQRGYDTFAALVDRFYNTRFVDNLIFGAPAEATHRAGVISVLAGDVFRDGNAFQDMLLQSRRQPPRAAERAPSGSVIARGR